MYCNSTDASYDLAEVEDFDTEMNNLMDADIGSQAGIFEKYRQGYASEKPYGGELFSSNSRTNVTPWFWWKYVWIVNSIMISSLILVEAYNLCKMPKKK